MCRTSRYACSFPATAAPTAGSSWSARWTASGCTTTTLTTRRRWRIRWLLLAPVSAMDASWCASTRTRDFWAELARALERADRAVVMDVCGDREDPIDGVDGRMVADAVRPGTAEVTYEPVWDNAAPTVARIARPGDLVITVGCGDVTKVAPKIVAELERMHAGASGASP